MAIAMNIAEIATAEIAANARLLSELAILCSFQCLYRSSSSACPIHCNQRAKLEKSQNSAILKHFQAEAPVHDSERLGIYTNI